MNKFSVDYSELTDRIYQQKVYRYEDVKERLVKVAFDIVRFREGDDIDGLWQIQATDDGEVIVAVYEEQPALEAKSSNWAAISDKTGSVVNIFYKGEPVVKFAVSTLGLSKEDTPSLIESLPDTLSRNAGLRGTMLKEMPADERNSLISKFPELNE